MVSLLYVSISVCSTMLLLPVSAVSAISSTPVVLYVFSAMSSTPVVSYVLLSSVLTHVISELLWSLAPVLSEPFISSLSRLLTCIIFLFLSVNTIPLCFLQAAASLCSVCRISFWLR